MDTARFEILIGGVTGRALALLFVAAVSLTGNAVAGTLIVASGGGAISADTTSAAGGTGAWTALTGPTYQEAIKADLAVGTVILTAPAGFAFNTAATVTVNLIAGDPNANKNINHTAVGATVATATVTATTITWTVSFSSSGAVMDEVTWLGIQVVPTAGAPLASGNIVPSGTSGIGGFAASAGTLTEVAGAAKKLAFVQQPSNAVVGVAISPAVTVSIQDQFGNTATSNSSTVTLAIGSNPGGGTLSGTVSVAAVAGVATFGTLSINKSGTGYTLNASDGALSGVASGAFNILPGAVSATVSTVSASPLSIPADGATTSTVTVTLKDSLGNPVSGKTVTLTAGSGSSIIAGGGVSDAGGVVIFTVKDGVAESVAYTATDTTDGIVITQTASVSFTGIVSSFNVVQPGANAVTGKIYTKIAGQNFALDIVALNAANAISTGFTGAVSVEVVDNTSGGGVCASMGVIATFTGQTFVAGDAGRHSLSSPNTVSNVWPNAKVRIKYPAGSPTVISCSGDNFAIRPDSLSLSVTDADWQTAGIVRTLNNSAATGGNVHKTGRPFTVRATALNAAAATTTNYAGTPNSVLTACAGTGCTATFGTFAIGTGTAVAGVISSSTATYTEVGAFALQLQDQAFAGVDAADGTTADCAGRYVCSSAQDVGRFVPDHFALSAASVTNRADLSCPACTFTYMGEQMDAVFTLSAQAAGNTITQNYAGALAKLDPTAVGNPLAFGALNNAATRTPLTARLDTSLSATGSFAAGVANVVAPLAMARCTAPSCPANSNAGLEDGPYAALDIGIAPVDADGVGMAAYDLDVTHVVSTTNDRAKVARTEVRYGRVKLSNANGSELLSLSITATVQYWNGAGYANSATDNTTRFDTRLSTAGGNVQAVIVKLPLALGNVAVLTPGLVTFASGAKVFTLAAPGVAGSVDLTVINDPVYLLPSAAATGHATFGVYKGAKEFIYMRENY